MLAIVTLCVGSRLNDNISQRVESIEKLSQDIKSQTREIQTTLVEIQNAKKSAGERAKEAERNLPKGNDIVKTMRFLKNEFDRANLPNSEVQIVLPDDKLETIAKKLVNAQDNQEKIEILQQSLELRFNPSKF